VKSAFVAVVGRPNVGKSTLINTIVGAKVSITSSRPQTTRNSIRGIVHGDGWQLVLVDLPGIHKPKKALGDRLNKLVYGTLAEADIALLVLDATAPIGLGDRMIAARLEEAGLPCVVAVNKTDLAESEAVAEMLSVAAAWQFDAYVPCSGLEGTATDVLLHELLRLTRAGPAYFPLDTITDQSEPAIVAELIREKWLDHLRDELPHSLTVVVEEISTRPNGDVYVDARAIVERASQKGILIGKGGKLLKSVGTEARQEIEAFFGATVYLDLRVRVEKEWQNTPSLLDRLGF
jgi:GTP-binding protein Era